MSGARPFLRSEWGALAKTCALGALVGIAVSWRVLLEPGVVGLVHDWSIAPFPEQHVALLREMLDGWYRFGLGIPIAYPLEYPLRLALAAAAMLGLGGAALSKAVVVLVPACAFVTATRLARTCRLPLGAAWLGGAFYALDPVMLNKLVSGQTSYLFGYALLPLVPAAFLASSRGGLLAAGVAVGGLLALVAMQVQLGILAAGLLLLLVIYGPAAGFGRRLALFAIACAVLALVELPTLVWLSHGVGTLERLDQFGHGAAWLVANSLQPLDAVRLIGYLTHYDVTSVFGWMAQWNADSWLVVASAAIGLAALPGPMRGVCFTIVVLTLAFVSGTNTAFGPAIAWLFVNVPIAQTFRELYHAMALLSLAYALGVASCFAFAGRLRAASLARAVLVAVVFIYVAPLLSGDATGWLSAHPVDRYLASAFYDQNRGPGRVVWFPLDQPLAFDGHGAGVDPMAVTERGSLWLYSLTWPLTAVDMAARTGDLSLLRSELRALGVAAAVDRPRMRSRFDAFSADGDVARRVFARPLALGPELGTFHAYAPDLSSYRILDPLPIAYPSARSALVPSRLSAIARASLDRVATFAFVQHAPEGVPYDVYYDAGDLAWEALETAGLSAPLISPMVDAHRGFAGGDVWWWYRPQYADTLSFALAIGRGTTAVAVKDSHALRRATFVVAWIATPAGGELELRCGGVRRVVDTGGAWDAWRSAALPCGPLARGASATIEALDADAEVALRGAALVDAAQFEDADGARRDLFRRAGRAVRLGDDAGAAELSGSGRSAAIGVVPAGARCVLELRRRAGGDARAAVRVTAPDGYLVARGRFARGSAILRLPIVGDGTALRIRPRGARVDRWRLYRFRARSVASAAPLAPHSPSRLLVVGTAFDGGWSAEGAIAHLPSALGTNVFVFSRDLGGIPPVRYAYQTEFRLAFGAGTLALLLSLLVAAGFARTSVDGESRSRPSAGEGSRARPSEGTRT